MVSAPRRGAAAAPRIGCGRNALLGRVEVGFLNSVLRIGDGVTDTGVLNQEGRKISCFDVEFGIRAALIDRLARRIGRCRAAAERLRQPSASFEKPFSLTGHVRRL